MPRLHNSGARKETVVVDVLSVAFERYSTVCWLLLSQVREVVRSRPSLRHISIVGHSLGGLIARYAAALLHEDPGTTRGFSSSRSREPTGSTEQEQAQGCSERDRWNGREAEPDDELRGTASASARADLAREQDDGTSTGTGATEGARGQSSGRGGTIAGLQPACFITLATPHLGVRGRGQLPFLLGVEFLERIATPMAPLFVGRTGKQLFLTDAKPPLLLQMADPNVTNPPFL